MAIILTNGTCFITVSPTGKIGKTNNIEEAQTFYSCNVAMKKVFRAPGKCKGYYPYDTEDTSCRCGNKKKRKSYTKEERKIIYDKTEGHCYLCGKFVAFDSFEVEHRIPISKGGTNELSNLYPSCHICNTIKQDIYIQDFMERITSIFMYQMKMKYGKCGKGLKWKFLCSELKKMI